MKKITSYVFIISGLLAAMGCDNNQGLKKTKSGLLYKIISDGKGEPAKRGQFLKLNFVQKIRDSIVYNSAEAMPAYVPVDTATPNYSVSEIFGLLRKGDSAIAIQIGDSIERKTGRPLPPYIKKKDKISLSFRVIDIIPTQDLVIADREKESLKEKQRESKAVEDFITSKKINAQKTAVGTYVEVKTPGDGPAVDSGKMVSVLYTGKSFPSGKVFETNMSGPRTEPIKFIIGQKGGMIQGWDDGLRLFKKGGKGTLYIPAFLAYDAQPGPSNKPYENLIFDVEITDVTDAPKPVQRPGMPPQRPQPQSSKSGQ
ncbi:MAG TPA: FKBP-type peptidyl-prolyl cis-trans isomerase [Puia sp.]|nr:FKBP-type peptidyl-prolyl cis-trans isomerase [Puia sp.]